MIYKDDQINEENYVLFIFMASNILKFLRPFLKLEFGKIHDIYTFIDTLTVKEKRKLFWRTYKNKNILLCSSKFAHFLC